MRVRFHEVDSLRIAWHGHYAAWFEEARRAFGRRFGADYSDFIGHNVAVPVVGLRIDYLSPARMNDVLQVTARLLKPESAKLEFEYVVRREDDGRPLARGSTIQVFTTPEGELLLAAPPFLAERFRSWEELWVRP